MAPFFRPDGSGAVCSDDPVLHSPLTVGWHAASRSCPLALVNPYGGTPMSLAFHLLRRPATVLGGLLALILVGRAPGQEPTKPTAVPDSEPRQVDLLDGLRSGDLAVDAKGTGDGRMTISVSNRTR